MSGDKRLQDKRALITGATRGQGLAIARLFHQHGCSVVMTDIREEGEAEANALGDGASFLKLDVSSEADWERAMDHTKERFGGLDILVNNAGMIVYGLFAETATADFLRQIDIDQLGVFFGMRAAYPLLKKAGGGSIINTSSTAGMFGLLRQGAYGATKQAVRAMTRVAATEWGRDGIRANTILPAAIRTQMLLDYGPEDQLGEVAAATALNRIGSPEDVANLALFLASDESAFCTGGDFFCDGGMHILK